MILDYLTMYNVTCYMCDQFLIPFLGNDISMVGANFDLINGGATDDNILFYTGYGGVIGFSHIGGNALYTSISLITDSVFSYVQGTLFTVFFYSATATDVYTYSVTGSNYSFIS